MRRIIAFLLLVPFASVVSAQDRPALAGVHASLLANSGFQFAGHFGRALTPAVAALAEVSVTTTHGSTLTYPCAPPGCSARISETSLSLAPGFHVYHATDAGRIAVTVAPGLVWFSSHHTGARSVIAKLGARLDIGWPLGNGPLIGLSLGVERWGSHGTTPRWVIPVGLQLGAR